MTATVLVVDDEPDIVEILRIVLEAAGFGVLTAKDGSEALALVTQVRPDAMLLDVGMPGVDGWTVLEHIKSGTEHDLTEVPVIMLTAWTSDEDRARGGIEGAVRYLAKPFEPDEIVAALEELLGPGAPPEPELRRRARTQAMEDLARLEGGHGSQSAARVHLTRLDRPRAESSADGPFSPSGIAALLDTLPPKQREVTARLVAGEDIVEIATALGVSRSNVYAIARRVARRAGAPDGRSLIQRLRRLADLDRRA